MTEHDEHIYNFINNTFLITLTNQELIDTKINIDLYINGECNSVWLGNKERTDIGELLLACDNPYRVLEYLAKK